MRNISLALLLTLSFPAVAMQETVETAVKVTTVTAATAASAYLASCVVYGKNTTNEVLRDAPEYFRRTKEILPGIAFDTGKQAVIVGTAAAGGIGAYQALATAMHHMSRPQ